MSIHAPQNMYKDVDIRIPRYRYARVPLNNLTSGVVSFSPTSSTLLEWRIPAQSVINLGKSYVSYQYTWPGSAAGNNQGLTTGYSVVHQNGCDFRTAYLGNGSGLAIADLQYADAAVNTFRPIKTKLTDFLGNDQLTQFFPCNQLASTNILPFSRDGLAAGTQNASTTNYLEQQYLQISAAPNTAIPISRVFPLSSFKGTVFEMDKDLVFGGEMYIRLYSNFLQRMGFYTTAPTNPNANMTPITTNVDVTNVYLYLAIEENLDIRNSLLTVLAKGSIKMTIPFMYTYRVNASSRSTNCSASITMTKNYGRAIKQITLVPYNGQELTQYAYDHSNVNGAASFTTLQTSMDGRPLTDSRLTCYNPNSSILPVAGGVPASSWGDDYREALHLTHASCLLQYPQYQTNWFYADCWGVPQLNTLLDCPRENLPDGFDLISTGDHVYAFTADCPDLNQTTSSIYPSGLVNYLFCEFVRTLVIQPDGIVLEP